MDLMPPEIWRPRRPDDVLCREDETHVFEGRLWFYAFSETSSRLRRILWDGSQFEVVRCYTRPRTALGAAQRFYDMRKTVHAKLDKRPPRLRRQGRRYTKFPRLNRIAYWAPESLSLEQLQAVWDRLHPTLPPRRFAQRDTVLHRVRVLLEQRQLVLVDTIPDGVGGMAVASSLHIMDARYLPPDTKSTDERRKRHFEDTDVISSPRSPNPKVWGSASYARFELYRDGMTVGEYIGAVGHRWRARADLMFDWCREYIVVLRDGVPIE